MSVLVFSAGRSGTNVVLEILTGHSYFTPTEPPEDKWVFDREAFIYPDTYLSKSDVVYCRSWLLLKNLLNNNPNMKIVWTIRHPYDMALSKINRGWKNQSDDATFCGCVYDLYKMTDLHQRVTDKFPDRVYTIRMEDILLNTVNEVKDLCNWLGIEYEEDMQYFYKRMRNPEKKNRYDEIDISQIEMYNSKEYVRKIGTKSDINIRKLFKIIDPIVYYFKYKLVEEMV